MTETNRKYAAGPLAFASVILVIAGLLNVFAGAAAIGGDSRFDVDRLLFESLTGWGIAYLIVGLLQIYAGIAIFQRRMRGLLLGIGFASLSGMVHFVSLGAYPIWSVIVMVLDFAILYALLTHDDAF